MRRHERGLTLIEILLALIVMVLGIVGILALFPVAMESSKISMETTQGAILSESVANSLATACRYAYQNTSGTSVHYQLTVTHDSIASTGGVVYYPFLLPNFDDDSGSPKSGTKWFHHPAGGVTIGTPSTADPRTESEWRLTGDAWTKAQHDRIKGVGAAPGSDPSEVLNQFGYSFDVRKVNTLEYILNTTPAPVNPATGAAWAWPTDFEGAVRCWEARIHTFRMFGTGGGGSGTGTGTGGGTSNKRLISTVSIRLTVR